MVVSLNDLACLDCLIWLRTGEQVAPRLALSQSAISRKSNRVLSQYDLTILRDRGEWCLDGDQELLAMTRDLHQHFRWQHQLPLRLDAQYYSRPILCDPPPEQWILGNFDFMEVHSPLKLLREGILDAWIGVYPDTPDEDDPELISFHLDRYPTHLVVAKGHPLLRMQRPLTLDDVREFPSLSLPDQAFPRVQQRLQQLGLWSSPTPLRRYRQEHWEGRTLDQVTVGYASAFTIRLFDLPQVVLPLAIDLEVGDTLVVRRRYSDHPRLRQLLSLLQTRVRQLADEIPELTALC